MGGCTPSDGYYCGRDPRVSRKIVEGRKETTCWDTYRVTETEECPNCGVGLEGEEDVVKKERIDGEFGWNKATTCPQCGHKYLSCKEILLRCRFCDHEFDKEQPEEEIKDHLRQCFEKQKRKRRR
jgi:hypothetical protein